MVNCRFLITKRPVGFTPVYLFVLLLIDERSFGILPAELSDPSYDLQLLDHKAKLLLQAVR